ncbi:MAG: ARMT1-like domain-containing protein [Bacteroidales bacterium]|jgi:hypothetical protein
MRIDSECGKCLLKANQKLFDKFNIPWQQQQELQKYNEQLMESKFLATAPEIQRELSMNFNSVTGINDPYVEEKAESNCLASALYQEWKPRITRSDDPFDLALRLSIAGNIMDYGANNSFDILKTINHVTTANFAIDHSNLLKQRIRHAKNILYLGDNAGEIVFDKLFIETIGHPNFTFAVKGGITLNDATMEDADKIGLHSVAKVISNGYNAPSTILSKCDAEFLKVYNEADLIISKGQGNLEGLINENDPRIFFLLVVKCTVIGEMLKVKKGSFVVFNQKEIPWE